MERIGDYQVERETARGGMAIVFEALAPAGSRVAVKLLLEPALREPSVRARFEREVEALGRVASPHVVRLLDHGVSEQGAPFLVMEYSAGSTLEDLLRRRGRLTPSEALSFMSPLCEAVQACHQAGVLHRDLKPGNALIGADGRVQLCDFGLARDVDPSMSRGQLSAEGCFMGTPRYWAPEQAYGELAAIGVRTDVYGLGATLYALLTGEPPGRGSTLAEVLGQLSIAPPPPSSLNPLVPRGLDAVVLRCLAFDSCDRYGSAVELQEALARVGASATPGHAAKVAAAAIVILAALSALAMSRSVSSPALRAPASPDLTLTRESHATPSPEASSGSPQHVGALSQRAIALEQAGRLREARDDLELVLELAPSEPHLLNLLRLLLLLQEDGEVVTRASLGLELYPTSLGLLAARSGALSQLGRREEALIDLDRCVALLGSTEHAGAAILHSQRDALARQLAAEHKLRGDARVGAADPAGALAEYTRALELDPAAETYYNRGVAQASGGHFEAAVEDFTSAIERDPRHSRALHNRASCWRKLGELELALADHEASIRLQPVATAYVNRSFTRLEQGDQGGARDDLERATTLDPTLSIAWELLGELRLQSADLSGAVAAWERALATDQGEGERAQHLRARIVEAQTRVAESAGS